MGKKFDISKFEADFFWYLYKNFSLDIVSFSKKVAYEGKVYFIHMENSRIIEIFDCSRDERKCIFSLAEKTA
jgi:hypothetical protein